MNPISKLKIKPLLPFSHEKSEDREEKPQGEQRTEPITPDKEDVRAVQISQLETKEPFSSLFPSDNSVLATLEERMAAQGFDKGQPLIVWENTLIDGHMRLESARKVGLKEVYVHNKSFPDEYSALEYFIQNNRGRRRKLTNQDLVRVVEVLDRVRSRGGDRRSPEVISISRNQEIETVDTSQVTAKLIGVGKTKVQQIRKILSHPIKDEVLAGKVSINRAYIQIKTFSSVDSDEETYKFYKSDDPLGCAPYGWNPIVREEGGNLKFIPNRLFAPTKTRPKIGSKLPERRVLVSPQVDLFDERVDSNCLEQILDMIKKAERRWTFLLTTDYPERLVGVELPRKIWIGVRVNRQAKVKPAEEAFKQIQAEVKFLVCDPLLEKLTFENLKLFDWLIIGNGDDLPGTHPFQPQWETVMGLVLEAKEAGVPVWFSKNLRVRPMEFPRRFSELS